MISSSYVHQYKFSLTLINIWLQQYVRLIYHFESDLINNMDNMHISDTVILSQIM